MTSELEIKDLIRLNEQSILLYQAGVELPFYLQSISTDPVTALRKVNTELQSYADHGNTVRHALDAMDWLPPEYRGWLRSLSHCGSLPDDSTIQRKFTHDLRGTRDHLSTWIVYPVCVCIIALLCFVGFFTYVYPELVRFWEGMEIEPPSMAHLYGTLRGTTRVWALGIPLVALLFAWRASQQRTAMGAWSLLPSGQQIEFYRRCSQMAELSAVLRSQEIPLPDALRMAAGTTGNERLMNAARAFASADPDRDRGRRGPGFPPLLAWALDDPELEDDRRVDALRLAADTYRVRALLVGERLRWMVPTIACVVLAGGATLAYGICLFWPLAQVMLQLGFAPKG